MLTKRDRFPAAEDFAHAAAGNHRAQIVGETTAGAHNGGSPQRLGEHFMMFVPSSRPINAVTGKEIGRAWAWRRCHATSAGKAADVAQAELLHALLAVRPTRRRNVPQAAVTSCEATPCARSDPASVQGRCLGLGKWAGVGVLAQAGSGDGVELIGGHGL